MTSVQERPEGQITALPRKRTRQSYSAEFKRGLVIQAQQPGVSVAAIALEHALNANLLRTWITKHQQEEQPRNAASIAPANASAFARVVPIDTPVPAYAECIKVRLPNGVQIDLSVVDADTRASWLLALYRLPCSASTTR